VATTLVKGGGILTMDATAQQIPSGYVLVDGTRIVAVGPMADAPTDGDVDRVIDASGCWVTPGLINMHQHHWYHLLKGLSEGLYLEDWVARVLLPAGEALRREDYLAGMRLAAADMLLTGTTSFFNHSVTEVEASLVDDLAETSHATGIRQFFGKELRAKPVIGWAEQCAQVEDLLTRYRHGVEERFSVDLVIESGEHWLQIGAMDADLASYAADLVRRFDVPLSDHVTGGTLFRSVKDFRLREGCGEVQWLARHGLLTHRTLLAHAVWIDESEMRAAAECGASVVTCPSSGAFTAGGTAPLRAFAAAGLNTALGTDGPMVNDSVDMLGQMRECFLLSSSKYLMPAAVSTGQLWAMATRNGARALGFEGRLGELSAGAVADLAVFDLSAPRYGGALNPPANLILSGGSPQAKWVLVGGEVVVDPGGLVSMDVGEVVAEARELARGLASRAGVNVLQGVAHRDAGSGDHRSAVRRQ
jgi:5-methylthioadenosine/S-adenosylhomocysteine deaminase